MQGYPSRQGQLQQMQQRLRERPLPGWNEAWAHHVLPVFQELLQ